MKVTRREMLGAVAAGAAAAGLGAAGAGCGEPMRGCAAKYKSADFYSADGTFDQAAAKKAYLDMLERFRYPIYEKVRQEMWVTDCALGRFTEAGLGGVFWINDKEGKYASIEVFLLPGQMIPEHWHVKTAEAAPKAEAWQLRYGSVTLFGEGEPTPGAEKIIPACELPFITVRRAVTPKLGDVVSLVRIESRHSMVAGPEGCIVTEYASYHDGTAIRFTDPKIKM